MKNSFNDFNKKKQKLGSSISFSINNSESTNKMRVSGILAKSMYTEESGSKIKNIKLHKDKLKEKVNMLNTTMKQTDEK
jgi:hypothetical protein